MNYERVNNQTHNMHETLYTWCQERCALLKCLLMIPFLFLNNFCYGFVNSGDTIMLCNNKCVLNLPKEKTYNIQYYEEGEFHNYYLINDSVQVTVHCGYLVNLPLNITAVRYIVSSKKKSNESLIIGYEIVNERKKYFIEKYFEAQKIYILFENISRKRLKKYIRMSKCMRL